MLDIFAQPCGSRQLQNVPAVVSEFIGHQPHAELDWPRVGAGLNAHIHRSIRPRLTPVGIAEGVFPLSGFRAGEGITGGGANCSIHGGPRMELGAGFGGVL